MIVTASRAAPPDDPFGPVGHDPDAIRDAACRLVSPESVCSPPDPASDVDPPDVGWLGPVVEAVVWVLFVALVVVLVAWVLRVVVARRPARRRSRVERDSASAGTVEEIGSVVVDRSREPADWRREADEHRRAGRWRDALRCRYRALVGDLARNELIDEIPGRTTGEERAQLDRALPAGQAPFGDAADLFDESWYGRRRVDDDDVATMEELERRVLAAAGDARDARDGTGAGRR